MGPYCVGERGVCKRVFVLLLCVKK